MHQLTWLFQCAKTEFNINTDKTLILAYFSTLCSASAFALITSMNYREEIFFFFFQINIV